MDYAELVPGGYPILNVQCAGEDFGFEVHSLTAAVDAYIGTIREPVA